MMKRIALLSVWLAFCSAASGQTPPDPAEAKPDEEAGEAEQAFPDENDRISYVLGVNYAKSLKQGPADLVRWDVLFQGIHIHRR